MESIKKKVLKKAWPIIMAVSGIILGGMMLVAPEKISDLVIRGLGALFLLDGVLGWFYLLLEYVEERRNKNPK